MTIFELPVVLEFVIFVQLVMTVTSRLRVALTITPPVLCDRNPCTEES